MRGLEKVVTVSISLPVVPGAGLSFTKTASFWELGDVATAVSRDLVRKAERFKQLAG